MIPSLHSWVMLVPALSSVNTKIYLTCMECLQWICIHNQKEHTLCTLTCCKKYFSDTIFSYRVGAVHLCLEILDVCNLLCSQISYYFTVVYIQYSSYSFNIIALKVAITFLNTPPCCTPTASWPGVCHGQHSCDRGIPLSTSVSLIQSLLFLNQPEPLLFSNVSVSHLQERSMPLLQLFQFHKQHTKTGSVWYGYLECQCWVAH